MSSEVPRPYRQLAFPASVIHAHQQTLRTHGGAIPAVDRDLTQVGQQPNEPIVLSSNMLPISPDRCQALAKALLSGNQYRTAQSAWLAVEVPRAREDRCRAAVSRSTNQTWRLAVEFCIAGAPKQAPMLLVR